MVGQGKRLKLFEISKQLVNKDFMDGFESYEEGKGLDCFTLILEYLKLRGCEIDGSKEFKGHKVKDYLKLYKKDKKSAVDLALGLFETFMNKIDINYSIAGDVLVLQNRKDDVVHFGINAGNGNVIVALTDRKTHVFKQKYFIVLGAYRWEQK